MSASLRASIVITNYNYGRFLRTSIDSALGQTYGNTEVVVVDDDSTDGSREIISSYGNRVKALLNRHGGQGAAFNAGFRASSGDVVCFLDADDVLLPSAINEAVVHFEDERVTKVHWPLSGIDEQGNATGEMIPECALPEGNLREDLLAKGPGGYVWSPTSGNAWARWFLGRIFPMPEPEYVTCADTYLSLWAPLLGSIKAIGSVQALYREHGNNNRYGLSEESIDRFVQHSHQVLHEYLREARVTIDTNVWRAAFRWPDRDQAMEEIARLLSGNERFALIDHGRFGDHFGLRDRAIRLPSSAAQARRGDPSTALTFKSLTQAGAAFLVVGWPAFEWWTSECRLRPCVQERFACVMRNARLLVFDLRRAAQH